MGKGDSNINYPAQPSYGEGMADALKAQVELLTGTGDFSSTGSLESLLPLEESIRKKTAQTDTDILRQTLLGGTTGGGEQEVTYDDQGRAIAGYSEPGKTQIRAVVEDAQGNVIDMMKYDADQRDGRDQLKSVLDNGRTSYQLVDGSGNIIGESGKISHGADLFVINGQAALERVGVTKKAMDGLIANLEANENIDSEFVTSIKDERKTVTGFDNAIIPVNSPTGYMVTNLGKNQNSYDYQDPQPIFAKDTDGNIIQDATKAGTTEVTTLPTQRQGDGMVDLLGDKRNVQDTVARPDYEQYVRNNPEYMAEVARDNTAREQQGLPPRSLAEWGEAHYARVGESDGDELPVTYEQADSGRQAGFDESGNFLGLSAFGEDIQAGNLSRQRERDLQDVARLSGTYQDIMEDYKPGTQEALESARSVLESQKESLTGAGAIGGPQGITDPLSLTSKGFDAAQNTTPVDLKVGTSFEGAQVADPTTLSAPTSYTPSAGVTGSGYTATAGLDGGQILQNDPVRAALMKDAEAALGQGLTDREERQIAEAARARSTMMGRTFDQSGAVAEAQARVAEDNQRKMQNRAFAQQALGQEAGFQESDLGRALQAGIQNQAAKNRAGEFTAGQDMQAQLANQQATNRASEFGVQAGLGQEQLSANMAQQKAMADAGFTQQARATALEAGLTQEQAEAQLNQQRLMANQQFSQEANKYGAQEDMQVQLNNLANQISNYQFETGAQMDADRLNEQLTQSGILGYIQAAGGLAALEDQSTLDPFQAVLGRGGGGSLQAGQSVFGQAGYGLNSAPQYLNPESGLGYIQNQATNAANMYNAQVGADATKTAGLYSGIGSALGGLGGGLLGNSGLFGGN